MRMAEMRRDSVSTAERLVNVVTWTRRDREQPLGVGCNRTTRGNEHDGPLHATLPKYKRLRCSFRERIGEILNVAQSAMVFEESAAEQTTKKQFSLMTSLRLRYGHAGGR